MAELAVKTIKVEGRKGAGDNVAFHATNRLDVMPVTATLPSHHYPKHTHDAFGIGYMVAGAQDSVYGPKKRITEAGDLMLTNPGEVHDGTPIDDQGRAFRMFYFQPHILYETARDLGAAWSDSTELAPSATKDRQLVRSLHRLHEAYLDPRRQAGDRCCTWPKLQVNWFSVTVRERVRVRPEAQPGVERVRQLLNDAPAESYELDQLAGIANLSKFHFVRSFRKCFGVSPFAYLTHRRVSRALEMLRLGDPIAQAAVENGFYDQAHFTRYFKQIYGVAPGAAARSAGLYG